MVFFGNRSEPKGILAGSVEGGPGIRELFGEPPDVYRPLPCKGPPPARGDVSVDRLFFPACFPKQNYTTFTLRDVKNQKAQGRGGTRTGRGCFEIDGGGGTAPFFSILPPGGSSCSGARTASERWCGCRWGVVGRFLRGATGGGWRGKGVARPGGGDFGVCWIPNSGENRPAFNRFPGLGGRGGHVTRPGPKGSRRNSGGQPGRFPNVDLYTAGIEARPAYRVIGGLSDRPGRQSVRLFLFRRDRGFGKVTRAGRRPGGGTSP